MINQLLNSQKSKTITLYKMSQTFIDGILGDSVWTLYKTMNGLYWKATGSKNNISEKFKEQISACIIVDPKVLTESEITTDCKITVSGEGDYRLVYADDIGGQGKVLQLNIKEWQ
jgi:hypothetical protein